MHRLAALILLILLAPAQAADKPARIFIENTYVVAPRVVGAFRLVEHHYDPAQRFSGAMFRYASVPEPEMTVDVFVYPAGRASQENAVQTGMKAFREDLANAKAAGYYRRVEIGSDEAFPLALAAAKDDDAESTKSPPADRIVLAAAGDPVIGQRIRLAMVLENNGLALQSRGFLFHRQLNYFKVRVSRPDDSIDPRELDRFADHAARTLVPAIEALNIGDCGNKRIDVDVRAKPEDAVIAMVRDAGRFEAENCALSPADGNLADKSRNAEVVRVDFEAGDWKHSP